MYCSIWLIAQYVDYLNMNRNDRNKTNSLKMLDGVWSGTVQVGTGTGWGTGTGAGTGAIVLLLMASWTFSIFFGIYTTRLSWICEYSTSTSVSHTHTQDQGQWFIESQLKL